MKVPFRLPESSTYHLPSSRKNRAWRPETVLAASPSTKMAEAGSRPTDASVVSTRWDLFAPLSRSLRYGINGLLGGNWGIAFVVTLLAVTRKRRSHTTRRWSLGV